jgi:hypothetical protein
MTDQTVGWMDTSISIPAYPSGSSYQTITFLWPDGVTKTAGSFSLTASGIFTNGEELILPSGMSAISGYYAQKDFPEVLPYVLIYGVDVRARLVSAGSSSHLFISLLNASGSPIGSPVELNVTSAVYQWFTYPLPLLGQNVAGIQLYTDSTGIVLDYIALVSIDYINQGGQALNLSIPKKTVSVTTPNTTDTIQQLGISSNGYAVVIPKATVATYNWLNGVMEEISPIELVTPTKQATGYVIDIKKHTEAGWVNKPLPTTDYLGVTATPQQLYDVSLTLSKTDNDRNIDLTVPPIPPSPLGFSIAIPTNDGNRANDSYQRHMWYMKGLWWVFYVQDTTLGNGFYFRTTSNPLTAWSAATQIITLADPPFEEFNTGIWYDGTYLYYVACDGASAPYSTANVYFRRGTPQTNGTIVWSAAEQTLTGLYGNDNFSGVVWVFTDSNGYSWAMNGRADATHDGVLRNANTDGTWSTNLSHYCPAPGATRLGAVPLPAGGQVVMFWTDTSSHKHKFQLYNGSSWGTVVSGTGVDYDGISFSAVTVGNQVHLTYVNTTGQIIYMIYDAPSNSILQESVIPGASPEAGSSNPPISTDGVGDTIIMWYSGSNCYATVRNPNGAYSTISQIYTGGSVGGRSISGWDTSGGYATYWFSSSVSGGADVILYWTV